MKTDNYIHESDVERIFKLTNFNKMTIFKEPSIISKFEQKIHVYNIA